MIVGGVKMEYHLRVFDKKLKSLFPASEFCEKRLFWGGMSKSTIKQGPNDYSITGGGGESAQMI